MPQTGGTRRNTPPPMLPALDGVRGVAILPVVLSHAGMGLEKVFPGTLGVVIFFVLSGFLITRQIASWPGRSAFVRVLLFYLRRILRLLPCLLAYLLLFVPLLSRLDAHITPLHIASGMLYFANYYHIYLGYPPYNPMPILWSLSVEEHYYILFPLIVLALHNDPRRVLPFLLFLSLLALCWRGVVYTHCPEYGTTLCGLSLSRRLQGTDMVFDCILYGAIMALVLRYYAEKLEPCIASPHALVLALGAIMLCLGFRSPLFRDTLRYSIEACACAVVLANIILRPGGRIATWLSTPALVFAGRISYPLYLTHFGVLITIEAAQRKQHLNKLSDIALYFALSFLLSIGLYFLVEKPMITVRRRFSQHTERYAH